MPFSALLPLPALLVLVCPPADSGPPVSGLLESSARAERSAAAAMSIQDIHESADDLWLGLELGAGLLVGDASDFLDGGFGLQGSVRWYAPTRWIAARATIGFLALSEHHDELSGINTDNTIFNVLAGPELILRIGPVEPHLFGAVGLAVNVLNAEGPAASVEETDATFAYGGGGGLRVIATGGRHPLALHADAAIVNAGALDFATLGASGPDAREENIVSLLLSAGFSIGVD